MSSTAAVPPFLQQLQAMPRAFQEEVIASMQGRLGEGAAASSLPLLAERSEEELRRAVGEVSFRELVRLTPSNMSGGGVPKPPFKTRLIRWIEEPSAGERRGEAMDRIESFKEHPTDSLNLKGLNLSSLPDISDEDAFKNLKSLILSDNQFTTLPDSMRRLTTLEDLQLNSNQLSSLPDWIDELGELTSLNLNGNQLKALPDNVAALDKLEILSLRSNQITALLPGKEKPLKLHTLDLSRNPFFTLFDPPWELLKLKLDDTPVGTLKKWEAVEVLEEEREGAVMGILDFMGDPKLNLDLSGRGLSKLPNVFQWPMFQGLQSLDLEDNRLSTLPNSLSSLTSLITLKMGSNKFEVLPECVGKMRKLEVLWLANNQLRDLPEGLVEGLSSLQDLDLSDNDLSESAKKALRGFDLICSRKRLEQGSPRHKLLNIKGIY